MIFNPLFLSENGNGQILMTKQNKLSENKYLFSDIVKVVMDPTKDQSSKMPQDLEKVVENQIKLVIEGNQKPVQMELKFLSDADTEQAKLNLAEILPAEIAQLLINEDLILDEEKAISYISKEPLKGELQQFVNSMIGSDVVAQNLSDKSGLLLSLEDKKSAVNLELIQDSKVTSKNKKITVQTLVVPQKSKLLSLVKQGDQNSLFRMKGESVPLTKESNDLLTSAGVLDKEIIKPTLSVYTFKYGENEFSSLTKSIKTNSGFKHNLNLLKNTELNGATTSTAKVPLEKISFVPSELKTSEPSGNSNTDKTGSLKLVPNRAPNNKDYSVSKITIVKKQLETEVIPKGKSNSESIPTELKRIDFVKQTSSINPKLHLLNTDGKTPKPSAGMDNVIEKQVPDLRMIGKNISQKKVELVNNESNNKNITKKTTTDHVPNSTSEKVKDAGTFKVVNKNVANNIQAAETLEKNVKNVIVNSSRNVKGEKVSKIRPENIESNEKNRKLSQEPLKNEGEKLNSVDKKTKENVSSQNPLNKETVSKEQNKIEYTQNKQQVKPNIDVTSQKVLSNNSQNNSSSVNFGNEIKMDGSKIQSTQVNNDTQTVKVEENSNAKSGEKENLQKSSANHEINSKPINEKEFSTRKSPVLENDLNKQNDVKVKDHQDQSKQIMEPAAVLDKTESDKPKDNKKISVKVKNGVKSVSKSGDSSNRSFEITQPRENQFNQNNESQDSNLKNGLSSINYVNPIVENTSYENYFQQVLNKEELTTQSLTGKVSETTHDQNRNVVRSVEVIREISKFISKQEKGSLSFDINPESLGKMKITLDNVDNVMRARIEVDNEQAKQMIEKNLDKLHEELKENGVQLNSLNISLGYSKEQKENNEEAANNKNHESNDKNDLTGEVKEEKQTKSMGYNTYEYLA